MSGRVEAVALKGARFNNYSFGGFLSFGARNSFRVSPSFGHQCLFAKRYKFDFFIIIGESNLSSG
jgi:hypothetical protein